MVFLWSINHIHCQIITNLEKIKIKQFCARYERLEHFGLGEIDLRCLNERVSLDIKPILVMMNNGFTGYDKVLPKTNPITDDMIPTFYGDGKYAEIIKYAEDEAKDFIKAYQTLKQKMPSLRSLL